jgi:dipeptidyl aminopeptidase/acylaminoacyl peptidase
MVALFLGAIRSGAEEPARRAMTFTDIVQMRSVGAYALSPDGRWMVYVLSVPDWKAGKNFTDLFLVSTAGGASRQMTFTKDKNETQPAWARDGSFFAFLSDREGRNQIYFLRPDGGEARRVTDEKEGVVSFGFSRDGKWLAYLAGREGERQLWLLPARFEAEGPLPLTAHETGVISWQWSPDGRTIYFTAADRSDALERERREKKFDVRIVDAPKPPAHLWSIAVASKQEKRLTSGEAYTVASFVISKDGRMIAFRGASTNRYATGEEAEVYLLEIAGGQLTRVTNNQVAETMLSFSPDSRWLAFVAPDEFTYMRNQRIYLLPAQGGTVRKIATDFDGDTTIGFWSDDGRTIYFTEGVGVTMNLYAISLETGRVTPLTSERGVVQSVSRDEDSGLLILTYTDPQNPPDLYAVTLADVGSPARWIRLTKANPQIEEIALGDYETIRWKSTDGTMVEGILVKPLGYERGKRYPLIVQIHGGPAAAVMNSFSGSYSSYVHIYAANGYAVFQPNYRGSSNYGEKFKMEIAGDYFRQGYEDIMSGVDELIARGIADPDKLAMMGWSAGGHWSNWTLVSTDRFKAISSGAGAVNWISMYAQTDVQVPREFYFKGMPYTNWDHYVAVSPLRYITRAKTPTLIHVGADDPRVPRPQSEELHMALKKLGVPTEFIVYPNMPHGLTEPRYQMVKMVAEFNWFEKWIKGKQGWLDWKVLLDTLTENPSR